MSDLTAKTRVQQLGFALGQILCMGVWVVMSRIFSVPMGESALVYAFMLSVFNGAVFVVWARIQGPVRGVDPLSASLGLLVVKLFVNSFTIFLLIGLQAVETRVFIPAFFAMFAVHLSIGIGFLHFSTRS